MHPKLDPTTVEVIEVASAEAKSLRHTYTGSEHILLALAKLAGEAREVLDWLDSRLTYNNLRGMVETLIPPMDSGATEPPLTPHAEKIMGFAKRRARSTNGGVVLPVHLLGSIWRDPNCIAMRLITEIDNPRVDPDRLKGLAGEITRRRQLASTRVPVVTGYQAPTCRVPD